MIDSNVALKWFLPEDSSDLARSLLARVREGALDLIAPDIFLAEAAHILRREVIRKRVSVEDAGSIWQDLRAVDVELHPVAGLVDEALVLALRHMGAVYDGLYIALAIREDLKVLTADDRMTSAFEPLDRTVSLASFR